MKFTKRRIVAIAVLCILLAPFAVAKEIKVAKVYRDYPGYIESPTCLNPKMAPAHVKQPVIRDQKADLVAAEEPAARIRAKKVYRDYPGYIESPTCLNPRLNEAYAGPPTNTKSPDKALDVEPLAAQTAEAERIAVEQAEARRIAEEQLAAETLAAQNLEADRLAARKLEEERNAAEKAEAERLAAEQAEQERVAALQAEAERQAAAQAEADRLAAQQAEAQRLAAEQERIAAEQARVELIAAQQAEAERVAAEQREAELLAAQQLEAERLAARKLEEERIAAEKAEAERLAAEQERIAAEQARAELLAAQQAEAERLAALQAEAEKQAAAQAEADRLAAQQAEAQRLAAEQARAEQLAAQQAEAERIAAEKAEVEASPAAQVVAVDENQVRINVSSGQAAIESSGPIEKYESFTLDNPPRLVVDVYHQQPVSAEDSYKTGDGFESVRVGTHENKVRFVFDASEATLPDYTVGSEANRILVTWEKSQQASAAAVTDTSVEEPAVVTPAAEPVVLAKAAKADAGGQEIRFAQHFPSFEASLQEADLALLGDIAEQLKSQKLARVDVIGHADNLPIAARSRHIFADNHALSEARARNVATYLQEQLGVSPERIALRGFGDSKPVADNDTEVGRALNRRVEITLVTESADRQEVAQEGRDSVENGLLVSSSLPQDPAERDNL